MRRAMETCLAAVAVVALGLALGGCPQGLSSLFGDLGATLTGQSEPMTLGSGEDAITVDCGLRTVTAAPASIFVEMDTANYDVTVSPEDSALAQALLGENPSGTYDALDDASGSSYRYLYEVDADGKVKATYSLYESQGKKYFTVSTASTTLTFSVDEGCLALRGPDYDPNDETAMFSQGDPNGPCGEDAFELTQEGGTWGISLFDPNETEAEEPEHICVSMEITDVCIDCWYADGVWHEKFKYVITLTALGSLAGVNVRAEYDPNDPNSAGASAGTVDIENGDTVKITWEVEMTYATTASPSELGYTQQTTPTYDPNDYTFDPNDFDYDPNYFDYDPNDFDFDGED